MDKDYFRGMKTEKQLTSFFDKKSIRRRIDPAGTSEQDIALRNSQFTLQPWQAVIFEIDQ